MLKVVCRANGKEMYLNKDRIFSAIPAEENPDFLILYTDDPDCPGYLVYLEEFEKAFMEVLTQRWVSVL